MLKRAYSYKSNKQEFLFAIKFNSTLRTYRLCLTKPFARSARIARLVEYCSLCPEHPDSNSSVPLAFLSYLIDQDILQTLLLATQLYKCVSVPVRSTCISVRSQCGNW